MEILVVYVHMCSVTLVSLENQIKNIAVVLLSRLRASLFLYVGCVILWLCLVSERSRDKI